jgi:hypothetical protein
MKALALAAVAVIGLGTAASAQAGVWFDGASYGGSHGGGPYFVAGFGDDNYLRQPRYWGGPYWTICRGINPPFQTYRIPPASCGPWRVKLATRQHQRLIRVRLK